MWIISDQKFGIAQLAPVCSRREQQPTIFLDLEVNTERKNVSFVMLQS
jgi:hypothetical protein